MTELIEKLYEPHVAEARRSLETDSTMRAILDPKIEPIVLERFLIEFSARGVAITEPVDSWIRRAGERCKQLGLDDLARSLIMHSKHEAGHHLMLIDDTKHMVKTWNAHHVPKLDADTLIGQPVGKAGKAYMQLHEDVIASEQPYAQVAVELEVEGMSVSFGPKLVAHCKKILGEDIVQGLSFITEHVAIDVGHTAFNEKLMGRVLDVRPNSAGYLGEIGSAALKTYIALFGECMHVARQFASKSAGAVHTSA